MPVSRKFSTNEDALSAANALQQAGFREAAIQITGGTVVTVDSPMGTAAKATRILENTYPGDVGEPKATYQGWNDSALMSSVLNIPVILVDAPELLSSMFGMPTVMKWPFKFSSILGLKLLTNHSLAFSSMFGMPLLSSGKPARR